jgi:cytochrome c2
VCRIARVAVAAALLIGTAACRGRSDIAEEAAALTGGDPARGKAAIHRYGCDTCHTIPGIRTARGLVGPPLAQIAERAVLAGHLPNSPANITYWIRHPQQVEPSTVMPEMNVTESDSRDIAAYLYTLR